MRWTFTIVGVLTIIGLACFGYCQRVSGTEFTGLAEAKSRLVGAGLCCTADCANGRVATGFLLSHEHTTWNEAGALRKIGPMGAEWQGKVWVTVSSQLWQLQTLPENAGVRLWGKVLAFGDENLLREIDDLVP